MSSKHPIPASFGRFKFWVLLVGLISAIQFTPAKATDSNASAFAGCGSDGKDDKIQSSLEKALRTYGTICDKEKLKNREKFSSLSKRSLDACGGVAQAAATRGTYRISGNDDANYQKAGEVLSKRLESGCQAAHAVLERYRSLCRGRGEVSRTISKANRLSGFALTSGGNDYLQQQKAAAERSIPANKHFLFSVKMAQKKLEQASEVLEGLKKEKKCHEIQLSAEVVRKSTYQTMLKNRSKDDLAGIKSFEKLTSECRDFSANSKAPICSGYMGGLERLHSVFRDLKDSTQRMEHALGEDLKSSAAAIAELETRIENLKNLKTQPLNGAPSGGAIRDNRPAKRSPAKAKKVVTSSPVEIIAP